ncbi:MAG: twin-arginine translocase subunit TatC [Acidobacteria bacterium]|nr:twin-arginine translocase subunit TatC [Acidobacteriota bacterium]
MALVQFPGAAGALPLPPEEDDDAGKMSFLEHLDELRKRIVNACIGIGVGIAAGFWFIPRIFDFVLAPTRAVLPPGVKMIYTQPGEAFGLYITISLIAGFVIASPYVMYQVWMFIAPGLYSNEKKFAIPFVLLTSIGFLAGAAFNHYVAFPFMMAFFASFNGVDLAFMPRLQDTFGLYLKMLIGMGVIFQMPTVVFFLAKMRLVTARFLWKNFRYAVLIMFVLAAIVTPSADPWNQTIFAAPMIGLYLISIAIAWIVNPRNRSTQTAD